VSNTLELNSDWDGSDFELLPGPNSPGRTEQADSAGHHTDKLSLGQRVAQWVQECAKSIARVVGGVCHGAVTLVKGIVRDCSKLLQDVANWCQRSIDELRRRGVCPLHGLLCALSGFYDHVLILV
jgi:hypothetical protein